MTIHPKREPIVVKVPLDDEGHALITVKDVIEALLKYSPDTRVSLDKDGWLEREIPHDDAGDLIRKRLLWESGSGEFICINN